MRVYIAGPLFTEEQRNALEEIDKLCKNLGFTTFLPHRDAGLWYKDDHKVIFQKDKEYLDLCDFVIAIVYEEDHGTGWEIGYAFSKDIPVLALGDPEKMNIMVQQSCKIVISLGDLKHELAAKARKR